MERVSRDRRSGEAWGRQDVSKSFPSGAKLTLSYKTAKEPGRIDIESTFSPEVLCLWASSLVAVWASSLYL